MIAGFGELDSPDCGNPSLTGAALHEQVMDDSTVQVNPDPFETIESLARTVAHLALQLTISQIQLRAMGSAIEEAGVVGGDAVNRATAKIARGNAGRFLRENLGPELIEMIDVADLERQIVAYLSAGR
jgi:hypothetical protein